MFHVVNWRVLRRFYYMENRHSERSEGSEKKDSGFRLTVIAGLIRLPLAAGIEPSSLVSLAGRVPIGRELRAGEATIRAYFLIPRGEG